eukprot:TRINITY_DN13933_c0_g1_i1.p1 TRINITY_DN13933_c0_g1~~TRINITY_DN13933_c0_g1_i1.p1  ORF type:complete len:364 (+),score=94.98 TRINITY_DN13933_c0_g1_i1:452-1543(+)
MATLAAIMREQEDERLAKQFFEDEQKFLKQLSTSAAGSSASSSVAVEGMSEEDQLALALALSAAGDETEDTSDYRAALEEQQFADAEFAVQLQAQERSRVKNQVHEKNMTILERKMYNMELTDGYDDDNFDEEDYEDEEEVLNPLGIPLDTRVHDRAQRREDADISTGPYRRIAQKTVNSLTQGNGTLSPLHHQEFTTRNIGKKDKDHPIHTLQGQPARRIFRGPETEDEVYGFVMHMYGGNHIQVLCMDGQSRQCTIPGKLLHRREFIRLGDAILVRVRPYQPEKGDVQMRYDVAEHQTLIDEEQVTIEALTQAMMVLTAAERDSLIDLLTAEPHLRPVADFYAPLKQVDWNLRAHAAALQQ